MIASDVDALGYTKRSSARILAELADAGFVEVRAERNAVAYRLRDAEQWHDVAGSARLVWPDWWTIFTLVDDALALEAAEEKSDALRRVAAAKASKEFELASRVLDLRKPVPSIHVKDHWSMTMRWVEQQIGAYVAGTAARWAPPEEGAGPTAVVRSSGRGRRR